MQTLERFFQQMTSGSGAMSPMWAALYYSALLLALGLLVLSLLTRRLLPWLFALAHENPDVDHQRKIRMAWVTVTALGPPYLIARLLSYTDHLPYRMGSAIFFFCLVYVIAELSLFVLLHIVFRRLLGFNVGAIFRDLLRMIIYALTLISIVRTVFEIEDISSLLALSSAASIIVGLALQNTLGNVFSGLFLQFDSPMGLNDWVSLEGEEGRVTEITWYSTKILTRDNQLLSIPNQRVANAVIRNWSRPTQPSLVHRSVGVSYEIPPNLVKDVLVRHMRQTPGVLAEPAPAVFLLDYGDSSITYELRYWIDNLAAVNAITDRVMSGVWYHLKRAEIEIPFPIRTVLIKRPQRSDVALQPVVRILRKVDFLEPLQPAELDSLAGSLKHLVYAHAERVCTQGQAGETFFIIWSGAVNIRVRKDDIDTVVARLTPGQYFGEMSLLTGEPRSASVEADGDTELLCLDRAAFGALLARNPGVVERMSQILAHRLTLNQTKLAAEEEERDTTIRRRNRVEESMYGRIMLGIRNIFG